MKVKTDKAGIFGLWLRPELMGLIAGSAVTLIITVLAALLFSVGNISLTLATAASTAAVALGGFCGGFVTAVKLKKNGLLCGMLCGFLLFICITTVSLIAFHAAPGAATLTRLVVLIVAGGLGGIFGANKAARRKLVK